MSKSTIGTFRREVVMESSEKTAWLSVLTNLLLVGIKTTVAGICSTILITWFFSRYEHEKGKETGFPSLVADAHHIWTDMLSSLVLLMALLGSAMGFALDKYAAIIVVMFIARSVTTIFTNSVRVLLDASLDHRSLAQIREIVLADPRVTEIQNLWARNAGRYKFIELD
ncbi:cation diffusion facilitator family transporter [Desulfopila sp. IMCC35008]|uniref:cation diffusion facilitator family transporter n=1 Tax=Desulfopila sp. IMCC35008 TaxID=2653858 RepID=UPI0013CF68E0|nr:cation transporter [Desulfopila sp. IMCC35008]